MHFSVVMHDYSLYIFYNGQLVALPTILDTVGLLIFDDKKFQGFRGQLLNHENKYPLKFLYTPFRGNRSCTHGRW